MISYAYEDEGKNPERNLDLDLYYCGTQDCGPGHAFGPGVKDHFKLHYIHSGRGSYTAGGATRTLSAGQVFLIYPDTLVRYVADMDDPWKYSWVAFDGLNAGTYMSRAGFDAANTVATCGDAESVESDLSALIRSSQIEKDREIRLVGLLYIFMSTLIGQARFSGKTDRMNDHVAKAVRFIEKNYSRDIAVRDMAEYVCLERKYFSGLFKAQTGLGPKAFLTGFRLKRAASLLRHTRMSVGQVSASVGYDDPFLFSKTFRLHRGLSPSEYRNSPPP